MYRYAQINLETGAIECISQLSGEVIADHMIPIDEDFDATNKYYIDGEWVVIEPEPEPEVEMTIEEKRDYAYANFRYRLDDVTKTVIYGTENEALTCDEALALISTYKQEDEIAGTTKAVELGEAWLDGKNYWRSVYPYDTEATEQ